MNKKTDIAKLLTTGSAKQRAVLLFYHFNIKEYLDKGGDGFKLPLTDKEAQSLFNSFTNTKDIKVYNDYRELNIKIIGHSKWLVSLYKTFEVEYWKYIATYLANKQAGLKKPLFNKLTELREELIIASYSEFLNYFTALKIYVKESGYRDRFHIELMDRGYKDLIKTNWSYPIKSGDKEINLDLSEIQPDQEGVKHILKRDFNIDYETEE